MAEARLEVEVVESSPLWRGHGPALERALGAAAAAEQAEGVVALLLADDAAVAQLNRRWRGKDGPTNVLSFPAPKGVGFLGDLALAAETIAQEAQDQGKSFENHAAHLAVHGFLHLLGYDHGADTDAEVMESRERAILASIGIDDPYRVTD